MGGAVSSWTVFLLVLGNLLNAAGLDAEISSVQLPPLSPG